MCVHGLTGKARAESANNSQQQTLLLHWDGSCRRAAQVMAALKCITFSREETGKVGAINHGVSIAERPRSVDTEAALLPRAVTTF